MIRRFKKQPITISAILLEKNDSSIKQVLEFMGQTVDLESSISREKFDDYCSARINEGGIEINTLEGKMMAGFGDYIIKGIKGEYCPCKPDIFEASYTEQYEISAPSENGGNVEAGHKTLANTTASQAKDNVKDIIFWGNGDLFKLLGKASSVNEGWMKSTKAMQIENVGCVVQVTTQQGQNVAEAVTFVPGVKIRENCDEVGELISRELISIG